MNMFSLKFETGSYFLKSMKCCTLGKITQVNIENLLWRHAGALSLQTQGNGMQISYEE